MSKVLIHVDETGRKVFAEDKGKELLITKTIDKSVIQRHLDENKRQYNATSHKGYRNELRKKNMWKVASIPLWVVEDWKRKGIDIFTDEGLERVAALLNTEEYKWLRTSPGKF